MYTRGIRLAETQCRLFNVPEPKEVERMREIVIDLKEIQQIKDENAKRDRFIKSAKKHKLGTGQEARGKNALSKLIHLGRMGGFGEN